jgi:CRP-like cAMP-binding protein
VRQQLREVLDTNDEQSSGMTESQVDRIRKAEEAVRELVVVAAQIRQEAARLPVEDPALRKELLETADGFETQARDLRNALRRWREDIH